MPGLNLIYKYEPVTAITKNKFVNIQSRMLHRGDYYEKVLYEDKHILLGFTGYAGYPLETYELGNYFIAIEGRVYNKEPGEIKNELVNIASNGSKVESLVKSWIFEADGEYIIIIINKNNHSLIVFNDALGRLPLYYMQNKDGLFLSREIKFVSGAAGSVEFDKMALAEYLLFLYPLGEKTLLKNIFRINPACLMQSKLNPPVSNITRLHIWSFDCQPRSTRSVKDEAHELADIFLDGCRRRVQKTPRDYINILSLSGGLDSRTVGAALKKINADFSAITLLDYNKRFYSDIASAEETAKCLDIKWNLFELQDMKLKDMEYLIKIKDASVFAFTAFSIELCSRLRETFGDKIIYYTGERGDKMMSIFFSPRVNSLKRLTDWVIFRYGTRTFDETCTLLNIAPESLRANISSHLAKYPETDLSHKNSHFLLFERVYKLAFEGEDRNRYYFWQVSPFYALPFFKYVMSLPNNHTDYYRLYKEFLPLINPECASIKRGNWGIPINSWKVRPRVFMARQYVTLLYLLDLSESVDYKKMSISSIPETIRDYALDIINTNPIAQEYFSMPELRKLLPGCNNEHQIFAILSVLIYMKLLCKET